jgi:hypothetical protein
LEAREDELERVHSELLQHVRVELDAERDKSTKAEKEVNTLVMELLEHL